MSGRLRRPGLVLQGLHKISFYQLGKFWGITIINDFSKKGTFSPSLCLFQPVSPQATQWGSIYFSIITPILEKEKAFEKSWAWTQVLLLGKRQFSPLDHLHKKNISCGKG